MLRHRILSVATVLVAVLLSSASSQAQMPPGTPPTPLGDRPIIPGADRLTLGNTQCRKVMEAPTSSRATRIPPFSLNVYSYSPQVVRGQPILVGIIPYFDQSAELKFTDFMLWAESTPKHFGLSSASSSAYSSPRSRLPSYFGQNNGDDHAGFWKVYPKFSGGAKSVKCNPRAPYGDTVGSFDENMLAELKKYFPSDPRVSSSHPSARTRGAYLWFPDDFTMHNANSIRFVAKLKVNGLWLKLESSPKTILTPAMFPQRPVGGTGGDGSSSSSGTKNPMETALSGGVSKFKPWDALGGGKSRPRG